MQAAIFIMELHGSIIPKMTKQRGDRMWYTGRMALLKQIMNRKRANNANGRSRSGDRSGISLGNDNRNSVQMTETRIYVGLNDADTKAQRHETGKYTNILKNVCRSYHVAFSMDIEEGGYFHDDGEYTEETSLILVLVDANRDIVKEIARDLCAFFHQESVLVTEDHIEGYFVTQSVDQ